MRRTIAIVTLVWSVAASAALLACVGGDDTSTQQDAGGNDATVNDVAVDTQQPPPDGGFTLSLAPGHITEDPGDTFPVTINVNRASNFTDAVTFTLTTPPSLTTTQPAPAGNSSLFYVTTPNAANAGDYQIVVTGTNGTLVEDATLAVHVGSLLAIQDGGVTIPFETTAEVEAWGAGGGAGPGGCNFQYDSGASGGVGGYASALVPVSPGVYTVVIGTGGSYNATCEANGGGGGGYSGFFTSDGGALLIAGGGGGGSSVWFFQATYGLGELGGAGGGLYGANGGYAAGGAPDGGGVGGGGGGSGASLQGGNGAGAVNGTGGTPGGGNGGTHAGGGGGGYFGGAGGGDYPTQYGPDNSSSGGGGAGYAPYDGGILITSDSGAPPNTASPDYANNAGAAGHNAAGSAGHVVIRLTKP
jgi:hypothetical protein